LGLICWHLYLQKCKEMTNRMNLVHGLLS
jgi:hypothetical protein